MQAIKYAAFASRFTAQTLAEHHAEYLSRVDGVPVPEDEAREQLEEHAGGELDPDLLPSAADHPDGCGSPPATTPSLSAAIDSAGRKEGSRIG